MHKLTPSASCLQALLVMLPVLGVSSVVQAQTTPLVQITADGASAICRTVPPNPFHSRSVVQGAGPKGEAVVQFDLTPTSTPSQFYLGWACGEFPAGPADAPRYARVLFRVLSPLNVTGNGDPWTDKFLIVGDPHGDRVIVDLKPLSGYSDLNVMAQKGVGGGPTAPLKIGQWQCAQFELSASGVKTYLNRTDRSKPNVTLNQGFNPTAWTNFNVGFYSNATLAQNGRVSFQIARAEYDDEFDPAFCAAPPKPPAE